MKPITKKRTKAFMIDLVISSVVTAGVEYVLRKKIKNEAFHSLVTPTMVLWGLEYAQLRRAGQTIGYKAAGITLENNESGELTCKQIVKRMAYRDLISTFDYCLKRSEFEQQEGAVLPHDRIAGTVVKELN